MATLSTLKLARESCYPPADRSARPLIPLNAEFRLLRVAFRTPAPAADARPLLMLRVAGPLRLSPRIDPAVAAAAKLNDDPKAPTC